MKIKFKHKKKCILKAMGSDLTIKEVNELVNNIVGKFMTDDSLRSGSQLAELIHNELPYEAILFVAIQDVRDRIRPDALERAKRISKKNEPSLEGFQKFVENLIQGIEKSEARKTEDTKPEKDASI